MRPMLNENARSAALASWHSFRVEMCSVSFPAGCSALHRHIGHVDRVRSKKQMIGSNARWRVASVQYAQTIGHWSVVDEPRESVRLPLLSVEVFADLPVTVYEHSSPEPTTIASFYSSPESLNHRNMGCRHMRHCTDLSAAQAA